MVRLARKPRHFPCRGRWTSSMRTGVSRLTCQLGLAAPAWTGCAGLDWLRRLGLAAPGLDWLRRLGLAAPARTGSAPAPSAQEKNQHHRQSYERAGANFFPRESAINMNC